MTVVQGIEVFVAQTSGGLALLLGLNYYALMWSFFGALISLTKTKRFRGFMAVGYVLFSTLLGALLSTFSADLLKVTQRSSISVMAVVCGASWQGLIAVAISALEGKFRGLLDLLFPSKP